jgi:mRNA interferase MazF
MRRGDVVIIAQRGTYEGKPRPAVVIQSDAFLDHHPSVLVCHLTSTDDRASAGFFRVPVDPTDSNGLRSPSAIMVDRISTIRQANVGQVVGHLDEATMARLDMALALFQGLA